MALPRCAECDARTSVLTIEQGREVCEPCAHALAAADRDRLAAENEKLREALRALDKLTRWSYPATIDEPDKGEAWFVRSDDIDRVLAALTREDNDA